MLLSQIRGFRLAALFVAWLAIAIELTAIFNWFQGGAIPHLPPMYVALFAGTGALGIAILIVETLRSAWAATQNWTDGKHFIVVGGLWSCFFVAQYFGLRMVIGVYTQ